VYSGCGGYVRSIALNSSLDSSNRLELLAAGSDDGTCRSWPIQSVADLGESTIETNHVDTVLTVDFKANILASGSKDYCINIVDVPMHQQAAAASRKHTTTVDAIGRFQVKTPAVVRSLVVRGKTEF
jgi:WD40 repeat protein